MAVEEVPSGFGYEGKGIVLWVPTIADPSAPTAAELNAQTVVPLTYSLFGPTGYALTATRNRRPTSRYALDQELSSAGTVSYELTLLYVYDRDEPTPAEETIGVAGVDGFIVHALGYPNGHTFKAGDKINDVVPVRTGQSDDVPQTANTEAHKTTSPDITGRVEKEVTVAGTGDESSSASSSSSSA